MEETTSISKRTNDTFLGELRQEILSSQNRRGELLKLKLTFISGFFGLGAIQSVEIESFKLQMEYIFYIIPLIALIFDLYIMGEDFGIKRAAKFIEGRQETPKVEKDWERSVNVRRDKFSSVAFVISSALILLICTYIIHSKNNTTSTFFWIWLSVSSLTVWMNVFYKFIRSWLLS